MVGLCDNHANPSFAPACPASITTRPARGTRRASKVYTDQTVITRDFRLIPLADAVTCLSEVVRALGQMRPREWREHKFPRWHPPTVGCNSSPGSGETVQKVESVQNGSSGQCVLGLTTFQDDPNNKTYCLSDPMLGNG